VPRLDLALRQLRGGSWQADSASHEIGPRSRLNRRANARARPSRWPKRTLKAEGFRRRPLPSSACRQSRDPLGSQIRCPTSKALIVAATLGIRGWEFG
jgi:hypothetical protein